MKKIVLTFVVMMMSMGLQVYADNGDLTVSGGVGIGTTTLTDKLNVNGNVYLSYGHGVRGSFKSENLTPNTNYMEISPAAWGQGATWLINATTSAVDVEPWANSIYKVNSGQYNTRAGILNFNGNSNIWRIGISPVSLGTGQLVTWTTLGTLSTSNVWFSPRGYYDLFINSSGNVGIGTSNPAFKLDVQGTIGSNNSLVLTSDAKFKKNLQPINDPLQKVLKLEGLTYEWKIEEYKDKGFSEGRHYGVIAQDVEKVLPELVKQGLDGTKAVAYTEIIPVLIEAIKEQQKEIDLLKKKLDMK